MTPLSTTLPYPLKYASDDRLKAELGAEKILFRILKDRFVVYESN